MIAQLKFTPEQKVFTTYLNNNQPLTSIGPLSKINFFIGANNSGKSRLLREILKELYRYPVFNPEEQFGGLPHNEQFNFTLNEYKYSDIVTIIATPIHELHALGFTKIPLDLLIDMMANSEVIDEREVREIYMKFATLSEHIERIENSGWGNSDQDMLIENKSAALKIIQEVLQKIGRLLPIPVKVNFWVTYVPILRSLRPFLDGAPGKNSYKIAKRSEFPKIEGPVIANRIFWDYFTKYSEGNDPESGREATYEGQLQIDNFFTGESLFKKIQELRNDVEHQRKILTDFEYFLSKQFFNNQAVALNAISPEGINDIYVKIGKEKEYPIYHLGDGIQAIILLTFPLFFYGSRPGHILFYEEPELYLHPGMQRIFIEAILQFPNVQVFIATHSNHFLDTSVDYPQDISIFSMEKMISEQDQPKFNLQNLSSPDMAVLNLLGVRNSSVFLANCCIWVEGISDRIYLKKYLQIYFKKHHSEGGRIFQEDLHFSFLEFGGNNIVHYNFSETENDSEKILAPRITNRIFLVHDQDSGKQERHSGLTKQLGKNYYCLDTVEIENLLTPKVLQLTLQEFKLKAEGELVFNELMQDEYKDIAFIEAIKKLTEFQKLRKIFPDVKPGVTAKLSNKADFARSAVTHISSWDDLSPAAQKLTVAIYLFIKAHNSFTT